MTHNDCFVSWMDWLEFVSGVEDSLCITIPQNLKTFKLIYRHTYLDGVLR